MLNRNIDTNYSGVLRIEKQGVKVEKIKKDFSGSRGLSSSGPIKMTRIDMQHFMGRETEIQSRKASMIFPLKGVIPYRSVVWLPRCETTELGLS